ncbi:hypothetical protein [Flavobacterium agrisoli]|uniref:Phospholipase D-like protein n=1 Tax=Flavobacterium agrisoli TaxID=2793066 RepID=A0A934PM19_9FLAO|nr:hypothetical protein [Flavobacterium agrisoli]MBK0370661.1 hypothetical protein [Flavobacterium agrisoli]
MEIEKKNLFKKVFVIALIFSLIGAFMKITHQEYASIFLIIGIILTLAYVIIGIYEVNSSKKIQKTEKLFWTLGFVLFSFFVGLFYFLSGRTTAV